MNTIEWKIGSELRPDVARHVLDAYVHRMTKENMQRHPIYARNMIRMGYKLPIIGDMEWLEKSRFAIKRDGTLDLRVRHCMTDI